MVSGSTIDRGLIMSIFNYYEYTISEHYLSALINNDETGISFDESKALEAWLETLPKANHFDVINQDCGNFTICDITGLHANCATVRCYSPLIGG